MRCGFGSRKATANRRAREAHGEENAERTDRWKAAILALGCGHGERLDGADAFSRRGDGHAWRQLHSEKHVADTEGQWL